MPCAPFYTENDASHRIPLHDACKPGLLCDFTLAQPTCAQPKRLGEACGSMDGCADGLYCTSSGPILSIHEHQVSLLPNPGTCIAAQHPGASCDDKHFCQVFEACVNGTCVHWGDLGDACATDGSAPPCAVGYCDESTHHCTAFLQLGEACDPTNSDCGLGLVCDSQSNVCSLPNTCQ
jgi:hypothetical protein